MGITRREALGWLGTIVAGTVATNPLRSLLVERTDPVIDLTKFCEPEPMRYNINNPFVIGERIYATDARRIITMASREGSSAIDLKLPPVSGLPWGEFNSTGWRQLWRNVCEEKPEKCVDACPACDGICIDIRPPHGPCRRCGGRGYVPSRILRSRINGVLFNGEFIEDMRQCGECEYRVIDYGRDVGNLPIGPVLLVRFGQTGRAIIMPMSEE